MGRDEPAGVNMLGGGWWRPQRAHFPRLVLRAGEGGLGKDLALNFVLISDLERSVIYF